MILKLRRYEYVERDAKGHYITCGYTIKDGVKPLGFKNERLVDTFEAEYLSKSERI